MVYMLIICAILVIILGYKLYKKQQIDTSELEHYKTEVEETQAELILAKQDYMKYDSLAKETHKEYVKTQGDLNSVKEKYNYEQYKLEECKKDVQAAMDVYQDMVNNKIASVDTEIEEQRQKRQEELNKQFEDKAALYQKDLQDIKKAWENETTHLAELLDNTKAETELLTAEYQAKIEYNKKKYESILATLAQYEKDKQAKLFYTIQLPDEFKEDIEFLLTTVAAKVQHPDIISKLVWAEYVKPNLDETFKRVDVRAESGIYKITNIDSGKAYIGKSTNVKTRIADHFKSSVGITSIADQAVHHAIRKEGFWNWSVEVIQYCEKEKLAELEKYYIDFFKTQDFGYNKNSGGGG